MTRSIASQRALRTTRLPAIGGRAREGSSVRYRPHPDSDRQPSPTTPRWLHDLSPGQALGLLDLPEKRPRLFTVQVA
jgi:hypothetical protein